MKYSFFLIAILVVGIFLPQDAIAQKRPVKVAKRVVVNKVKKNSHNNVKRTGSSRKVRAKRRTPLTPVSSLMEAIVAPRCSEDSDHMVVQIYSYPVVIQNIIFNDNKLQARKADGSLSSNQSDFISPQDYILATKLLSIIEPDEMELYPSAKVKRSSYITNIVLVKKKWTPQDGEKVYQLLKVLLEPTVKVNYIGGECGGGFILEDTKP